MGAGKRAAHLNKLAKAKRQKPRAAGGSGANFDGYEDEDEGEAAEGDLAVEAAGEAARRNRNAFKERRHRERLRGVGAQAGAMAAFVLAPATGIARGVVDQLVDAAFAVVAETGELF